MTLSATAMPASGDIGYTIQDARTYVLEKIAHNDIVFMGTTHKEPSILDFVADLLPRLHTAGITHVAVEVASDQQARIERYLNSGTGLAVIAMHQAIDCPRYRHLFDILRRIEGSHRPKVVAIDLPVDQYNGPVSRDAHMAASLDDLVRTNPNAKILAILGTFHVLRQLRWDRSVPNGHKAIRTVLARKNPHLNMFSMAHILSQSHINCDFSRRLGPLPGTVAVDMDATYDQWQLGLTACLSIQPSPTRYLLEGVIVH